VTPLAAVTLDAAGTLFDVAEPVGTTYARVAAAHGIRADAAAVERRFRSAFGAAPPLAFPGASPARLRAHERAWWGTIVREALGPRARGAALDAAFDALFAHYATAAAWRVPAGAPSALARMRAAGLRLAVVSNFDGRLPGLLRDLGLAALVDHVAWSSNAGAAKPAAAIFHGALAALGVPPGAALHAGDGRVADVDGARAAGMRAVLVAPAAPPGLPPDVGCVAAVSALPALLGIA